MAHIHQIPALRKSRDLYFSGGCLFVRQLCFCGETGRASFSSVSSQADSNTSLAFQGDKPPIFTSPIQIPFCRGEKRHQYRRQAADRMKIRKTTAQMRRFADGNKTGKAIITDSLREISFIIPYCAQKGSRKGRTVRCVLCLVWEFLIPPGRCRTWEPVPPCRQQREHRTDRAAPSSRPEPGPCRSES